jgi:predicted transposase YdaD
METDGPLKLLFERYPEDLLALTGDVGASVQRSGPVEIQALKRRVDCVFKLERSGELYYRHIEFQAEADADMPTRCFRYNTQLLLQYGAPVLTTVLYLFPPKPKLEPVFRVILGGLEVNRWSFAEVCLWELDATECLSNGAPGLLALIPLMRGGIDRALLGEAALRIERAFPDQRLPDAEDVLLALAGRYYTEPDLARMFGRDRMIQSSLYTAGLAEGRLESERELCSALVRKYHSAIAEVALALIASCQDTTRLREWALAAGDLDDVQFLSLLRG